MGLGLGSGIGIGLITQLRLAQGHHVAVIEPDEIAAARLLPQDKVR